MRTINTAGLDSACTQIAVQSAIQAYCYFGVQMLKKIEENTYDAIDTIVESCSYKESMKSINRLQRCLDRFQKIENKKSESTRHLPINVSATFVSFSAYGHTQKNALLLTKMTIRGQISIDVQSSSHGLFFNTEDTHEYYIKKFDKHLLMPILQTKEAPHYRDLEFGHKKKKIF